MNSIMSKKRKPVLTFVLIFVLCFAMSTAAFAAIRLNRTHLDCAAGAPRRLKAEGTSAKVTWRSSNTARATVNSQGYVKGIRRGGLTVTAKIGSTTKKCTVTVLSDRDVALRVYGRVKQKYAKTSPQRAVFCMLNKKREVPVRNLPSVCRFAEHLPRTAVYTTPWASIAVATFSKPAMLAPAARLPFMPYFSAAS